MKPRTQHHQSRKPSSIRSRMAGAGLVEVLVALIVIGVGMLGIASLYVVTMQAKATSRSRMQAVFLAADMAERIRANSGAAASYALAQLSNATAPGATCVATGSTSPTAPCTPVQMAATDLNQWASTVSATLPGTVAANITVNGTNPTVCTITLNWSEPNTATLTYQLAVEI